jgi:hypothetical protein
VGPTQDRQVHRRYTYVHFWDLVWESRGKTSFFNCTSDSFPWHGRRARASELASELVEIQCCESVLRIGILCGNMFIVYVSVLEHTVSLIEAMIYVII